MGQEGHRPLGDRTVNLAQALCFGRVSDALGQWNLRDLTSIVQGDQQSKDRQDQNERNGHERLTPLRNEVETEGKE